MTKKRTAVAAKATGKAKAVAPKFDPLGYVSVRGFGLGVAALMIGVDGLTKLWALKAAAAGQLPLVLHPDVAALVLAFNRGMSFSLMNDGAYAPIILSVVAMVASIWFIHWLGESRATLHQTGLGLVLGGALGNLLDRLQHGAVVDFLLPLWNGQPWFPAFNVADSCISIGLVVILLHWFLEQKQPLKKPAKGEK